MLDDQHDAAVLFGSGDRRRGHEREWLGDALVRIAGPIDRQCDFVEQLVDVEWLLDDLARTERHQIDVETVHRGHDQDGDVRVRRDVAQCLEKLPPVHPGHHQIEQDRVGACGMDAFERALTVDREIDDVAFVRQDLSERLAHHRLVINDEYAPFLHRPHRVRAA